MFDHRKYRAPAKLHMTDRTWPDKEILQAPLWCSVDLRDGNQALINPMNVEQKTRMFNLLVKLGFKEIEVGFPSASQPDFDFVRKLITEDLIPDDVCIQILTQAREDLIKRSYEALEGVKKAIVHVYNSTSRVQREQVFALDKEGIKQIAIQGALWVKEYAAQYPNTEWGFQYSPESFTGTEMDYAVEVCDAVINTWNPASGQRVIINLPATVEMTSPNVFADQVEWFCRHVTQREHIIISLHTHNDRGCGVAAAELGIMAGADRIEGTLIGNGERTGNMDIVTMAMNMYSQGVDPKLDLSNIKEIIATVEYCTELPVAARHPWAGELVYTAFSGSHQDAIRKSISYHEQNKLPYWEVAYLPIDPRDIGREYEAVVRINSQSGKGGVALVLERDYGISLPKWMHSELSKVVQKDSEASGAEVAPHRIKALYDSHFADTQDAWKLTHYNVEHGSDKVHAKFTIGESIKLTGMGSGPVEALCASLSDRFDCDLTVLHFDESSAQLGNDASATACISIVKDHQMYAAVATGQDTSAAALQALLNAFAKSQPQAVLAKTA